MSVFQKRESNSQSCLIEAGGDILLLDMPEVEFRTVGASSHTIRVGTDNLELPTGDLRDCIAFEFASIPEVAYVYTAFRENEIFYAWIVTDTFDRALRQAIYAKQRDIIDEFPMFQFDFYIIPLNQQDVSELIGDPSIYLTFKRR